MRKKQHWFDTVVYHGNGNFVALKNLPSLAAPEFVKMTSSGSASDDEIRLRDDLPVLAITD